MIRVFHLITSLDTGGAEMMLNKVSAGLDKKRFSQTVACLKPMGDVGPLIQEGGVPAWSLGLSRSRPNPLVLGKLLADIRNFSPHILMTWLYHADLAGLGISRFFPSMKLVWNLRCSQMDMRRYSRTSALVRRVCARFSHIPDLVVANSRAGILAHEALGYDAGRFQIIANGFDTKAFAPDPALQTALRQKWGIPHDAPVMGMAARFDPMKGQRFFLKVASAVAKSLPKARFLMCGKDVDKDNRTLMAWAREYKVENKLVLMGKLDDMNTFYNLLDVFCLCSDHGEGFPNVLGEAMSCGRPGVVTDVGDSREIVARAGAVVRPDDVDAYTNAVLEILSQSPAERRAMGQAARSRIKKKYSIKSIVCEYEKTFEKLAPNGL